MFVLLILLPSDCDCIIAMFVGTFCGVHSLPVILLPLGFTALFAPWSVYSGKMVSYSEDQRRKDKGRRRQMETKTPTEEQGKPREKRRVCVSVGVVGGRGCGDVTQVPEH